MENELEKILCEYDELIQKNNVLINACLKKIDDIRNCKVGGMKLYNEVEEVEAVSKFEQIISNCKDHILKLHKIKKELLKKIEGD